ncbi:MAG: malate synthase A [Omnitrophica WOR_2 bacterium]
MTDRAVFYKTAEGIQVTAPLQPEYADILTPQALSFLRKLESTFGERRLKLLQKRADRQKAIDAGRLPDFLPDTQEIREDPGWRVASTPDDLQKRRVEITGPTDRKMMINALNSGASVFMADFEDANSHTWQNMVEGHINLRDAIDGTITYTNPDGKIYKLNPRTAVLMVRPRGWHLVEKHVLVDGKPMTAALFDFGLYFFHNARKLIEKGTGPYFYLPKMESHLEARLWNDIFNFSEEELGIPGGTIRATVLIETILAAFEMEEILYELREHSAGLNAGRWDYIFSIIKKFRSRPGFVLPDRAQITMTVPFMRAYTELLVRTCHKRGAHAIGGMAAYIPSRKDPQVNEIALSKVCEDKERESGDGFDGTWVAHPDLVPVAMEAFDNLLGEKPHQKERLREDVQVTARELIDFRVPGGEITEKGLRLNINVGLQYIESWLRGTGAVAIYNLMEDTATAEISRAQVWQWIHSPQGRLVDGRKITAELYQALAPEELTRIRELYGDQLYQAGKFEQARQIFDQLVLNDQFVDFLTLVAYQDLE